MFTLSYRAQVESDAISRRAQLATLVDSSKPVHGSFQCTKLYDLISFRHLNRLG